MLTLWDFSLRFYALDGVADACLSLQDRHGIDVNRLMLAAWAGYEHGVGLGANDLARIRSEVEGWTLQVVQPLRAIRRQLKAPALRQFHPAAAELRDRLKQLELDAERLVQARLQDLVPWPSAPHAGSLGMAQHNLAVFLAAEAVPAVVADAPERLCLQSALQDLRDSAWSGGPASPPSAGRR